MSDLGAEDLRHPATLTPRQRERRGRLLDAALSLVLSAGYDRVQVKEVADTAGVSLATLYNYYSSKERLFAEVLVRWTETLPADVRRRPLPAASPGDRLKETARRAVHAFELAPEMAHLVKVLEISNDPVSSRLLAQMERATGDAYMQALADVDTQLARRIVHVVDAIFTTGLHGWSRGSLSTREFYDRVFSGIELVVRASNL